MTDKTNDSDLASRLEAHGRAELDDVAAFIDQMSDWECGALLLEVTRCLDHAHFMQFLTVPQGEFLSQPDFDIVCRGWNVALGLLLPRVGMLRGVPAIGSSPETQRMAISVLHGAGRYVILTESAERIRHGLISAELDASGITLAISDVALLDFFHDQVDRSRLADLRSEIFPDQKPDDPDTARALRSEMAEQTFRWEQSNGVMVGYSSTPAVDKWFSDLQASQALEWRDDAGIHPDTALPGCNGGDLMATVSVMLSFYLKHIIFVEEARKRFSDVNHHMSLTIWKTRGELVASLEAVGSPKGIAEAVIDLLTVRSEDAARVLDLGTPVIPMLIAISDEFLLTPASAIFQNPFRNVRLLREEGVPGLADAVRVHRENWMAKDLYSLFEGTRFQRVAGQTVLASKGRTVTDIDAAVFDWLTGELVLFQLKWQDFNSTNIRSQKSKAKNFVRGVASWGDKVTAWIDEYGVARLCQALQIKLPAGAAPSLIRLWGVGRSNARFESLGYPASDGVLTLTWPQLVRLRHKVGLRARVFEEVARRAAEETSRPIQRQPIPYNMPCRDMRVLFKDIWSTPEEQTPTA